MCHRNLVHSTTLNLFATAHFMLIALLYDPDPNLEREDVLDKISLVLDEYIATEPTHILGHQQIRKFIAIVQNRLHLVRRPKATQNVFMSEFEEQSEANIIVSNTFKTNIFHRDIVFLYFDIKQHQEL